ncbi:MAG TPA: glycoside hydrolase family 3 C-terminal domain-containing protein [Galbitalea sp.]
MSTLALAVLGHRVSALDYLVEALSLEERAALLASAATWKLSEIPSIGLRSIVLADGIHGVACESLGGSSDQLPAAATATWDVGVLADYGTLVAREARRGGIDVVLAPAVASTGSRGAQPELFGRLAASMVSAIQRGGVGAGVQPTSIDPGDFATIDSRAFREQCLAPFEHVVRHARPRAVFFPYRIPAATGTAPDPDISHILIGEWGFDGLVVGDARVSAESVETALAGVDVESPGLRGRWGSALVDAVRAGKVAETDMDDRVIRILRLAERLGALSGCPGTVTSRPASVPFSVSDAAGIRALRRRTAAQGTVVLRNELGLLPLAVDAAGCVVIHDAVASASGLEETATGIVAVLRSALPATNPAEVESAVAAAAVARTAIVIIESPNEDLVRRVVAVNPRTIVVVSSTSPIALPWLEDVPAALWRWGADDVAELALADVLVGAVEPAGRLPWELPSARTDQPGLRIARTDADSAGARPFGFGLGYTTWDYLDATVRGDVASGDVVVAVTVRNTGRRSGREVVQLYVEAAGAEAAEPSGAPVRLAGFGVVEAVPGESVVAELHVDRRSFERWDSTTRRWTTETARYRLRAGRSSADLRVEVQLVAPLTAPRTVAHDAEASQRSDLARVPLQPTA